jgi:hypothetical protein
MTRAFLRERSKKASRGRQSGRNAEEANSDSSPQGQTLSLSLATLVTTTTSTPVQDNISLILPLMFHLASTHLGRDTQRQIHWSVDGPRGSETPTVGAPGRGLLRVDKYFPVEFQMGSLQRPLQPRTVLHFGSLEFMSLDGSYDMVLLPSQHDNNDGRRLARRRRVDDTGTPTGDMSGVVLAPKTTTGVASLQRANRKRTDDADTLARDLLGICLAPKITTHSVPDATSLPSINQEVTSVFHPVPFRFSFDPPSDPASVSAFARAYPDLPGYHMWST